MPGCYGPPHASRGPRTSTRVSLPLTHAGVCARRDAADLVRSGKVTVDGVVVTEPGFKVNDRADVEFEGKKLLDVFPELANHPFTRLLKQVADTGISYRENEVLFNINPGNNTTLFILMLLLLLTSLKCGTKQLWPIPFNS